MNLRVIMKENSKPKLKNQSINQLVKLSNPTEKQSYNFVKNVRMKKIFVIV